MESGFTYHCQYSKYHYQREIKIIRVECLSCGTTHALIPEFSLPGSSIGTTEANTYISLRQEGRSQRTASAVFSSCGTGENYGRRFEVRLKKARLQAMALFPDEQNPLYDPLGRFESTDHPAPGCIQSVNKAFAEKGYNPLYFSRRNILRIRENKLTISLPLNKGATRFEMVRIDSS